VSMGPRGVTARSFMHAPAFRPSHAVLEGGGATTAQLPTRIARYTILRKLGEGGMGIVYEAEQENPARTVAVKLIRTVLATPNVLHHHLQTRLVAGGLAQAWHRLAEVLHSRYEEIAEEARQAAVLHAHETGWRVNGVTHWLWCFAGDRCCCYTIDRCRGSPALMKFFGECFEAVLVTDFWAAYESVCAQDRQYCLVHLLRELEKVELHNTTAA